MALTNAEQLFNQLVKNPSDVTIDIFQGAEIWRLFKKSPIDTGKLQRLEYRAFLQAALMAAIDGSAAMGYVESLFHSALKPTATAKDIIKAVVKDALKRYYKNKIKDEDPPIYEVVLSAIAYQCSTYFDSITNELDI